MNNIRKTLLALSLLGAATLPIFSGSALADDDDDRKGRRKDVKEARKDLKKARKDVRRADTPEERRDAREDYREEKRDYREEVRENRGNNGRPYGRPSFGNGNYNRPNYNRPNYNRPNYNRPNYNRPTYNRPTYNNNRSLQGVVTNDLSGNDFLLRTSNGQVVKVYAINGESGSISRGDTVRVSGSYSGSGFRATSISILNNR